MPIANITQSTQPTLVSTNSQSVNTPGKTNSFKNRSVISLDPKTQYLTMNSAVNTPASKSLNDYQAKSIAQTAPQILTPSHSQLSNSALDDFLVFADSIKINPEVRQALDNQRHSEQGPEMLIDDDVMTWIDEVDEFDEVDESNTVDTSQKSEQPEKSDQIDTSKIDHSTEKQEPIRSEKTVSFNTTNTIFDLEDNPLQSISSVNKAPHQLTADQQLDYAESKIQTLHDEIKNDQTKTHLDTIKTGALRALANELQDAGCWTESIEQLIQSESKTALTTMVYGMMINSINNNHGALTDRQATLNALLSMGQAALTEEITNTINPFPEALLGTLLNQIGATTVSPVTYENLAMELFDDINDQLNIVGEIDIKP